MYVKKSLLITLFILAGFSATYAQQTPKGKVVDALESFHKAIIENDSEAARNLLSESARILEGGNIETKKEYLSHHFHSDGKFLSAMAREVKSRTVNIKGQTAWVSTRTHTTGTYNDRSLDLNSLELAVLSKKNGAWKIEALHWSSRSN